ncbi:uncharacterized protein LOC122498390 [Leptopilina heterotoma]|uniref:uncharacterized protein LOC122498390 n=1 Tax=Leptopilina heterotoma TaxID=63436 RepID=UPI001CA8F2B6|nr:uncharacterized protein LOC122498390 [Leptopilina heterotoma]
MEDNSRKMKYPYTYSAKIAQFPYQYYFKHSWMIRYCCYAAIVVAPIIYQFQKMSFAPANVKKWEEIDRKTYEGH